MVELRKRKPRDEPPAPPPKRKSNPVKAAVEKAKAAVTGKGASAKTETPAAAGAAGGGGGGSSTKAEGPPAVGATVTLDDFGGEVETNEGEKTTLKALVEASKGGVVLFTYPKASTPGCTTQACLFRDSYAPLTATGLAIYGLSRDSAKANTTFRTKQALPYPLLCDPAGALIRAIGLAKAAGGTQRGVFAVDRQGRVLLAEPGGPQATVDAVKRIVGAEGGAEGSSAAAEGSGGVAAANGAQGATEPAAVAAEVADSAAKVDSKEAPPPTA